MGRFTDYLNQKAEDIEPPAVLPIGTYMAQVQKHPEFADITSRDKTRTFEKCTFQCKIMAPIEVDEDELAEFGNVKGVPFRIDYLMNTDEAEQNSAQLTLIRIKTFLETLGVFDEGTTLQEGFAAAAGQSFGVTISHRLDGERTYLEVDNTFIPD